MRSAAESWEESRGGELRHQDKAAKPERIEESRGGRAGAHEKLAEQSQIRSHPVRRPWLARRRKPNWVGRITVVAIAQFRFDDRARWIVGSGIISPHHLHEPPPRG